MAETATDKAKEKTEVTKKIDKPQLHWDDSKMQTTYANVVNATSTREEVSIFFGTNQTWNLKEGKDVTVELSDRIVLNPYAAKRMLVILASVVAEYEKRFGVLPVDKKE